MKLMIRQKIIGLAIIAALLPVLVTITLTIIQQGRVLTKVDAELDEIGRTNLANIAQGVYDLCDVAHNHVQEQVEYALNVARDKIQVAGGISLGKNNVSWNAINQYTKKSTPINLPQMLVGRNWLGKVENFGTRAMIVDEAQELAGGTCTIFQRMNEAGDMLRVSTNVRKLDNTRAVGTYIPAVNPDGKQNPVVSKIMKGETYRGRAFVVNAWYITVYEPIRDNSGRIIGTLYTGVKQEEVESLRKAIMDVKVGKTGYVYALGGQGSHKGNYVISKDGARDGENIWEAKDADGRLFIQDIINNALARGDDIIEYEVYPWQNKGETVAKNKVVATIYFEPWDWVIGAGTYIDEYKESNVRVSKALTSLLISTIIGGLVVLAIAAVVAILFGGRISKPLADITDVAQDIAEGDLSRDVDIHQQDEVGILAETFRRMQERLKEKAEVSNQFARGNLNAEFQVLSDRDLLGKSMKEMQNNLQRVLQDLNGAIEKQQQGDLDARTNPSQFEGGYAELAEGMNNALDAVVNPINEVTDILEEYAAGDLTKEIRELPGKQVALSQSLTTIRTNLQALIDEGVNLAEKAEQGELSTRASLEGFQGGYRKIIEGMNRTLDNVLRPINEGLETIERMAKGDLTSKVTSNYKGDHARIKNSLNSTLDSLNEIMSQITVAAKEVRNGAVQVSDSSQTLSQGATEQASSLEEVTSSMTEIGSQTKTNAENARQANQLAKESRSSAESGNEQMSQMLQAMEDINQSSGEISRIIKVIDEIAFQTNLLALNAAVEAARAGIHGKGFAVVAEEVRNLAQRSATAARETTELISGSGKKVEAGSQITNETAIALGEMVTSITKVTDLVGEIASASDEQAQGIDQVNDALSQIDGVTQSNASNAEESASASEQLSSQANYVQQLISRFKIAGHTDEDEFEDRRIAGEEMKLLSDSQVDDINTQAFNADGQPELEEIDPNVTISMDDDDLEDF